MRAFGATENELGAIAEESAKYDFRYRRLDRNERDDVIQGILNKLDSFTKTGAHRHEIWESCWADARTAFDEADNNLVALDPTFLGAHPIVRIGGDFAKPRDPKFETHWFRVMRRWLFERFMPGASRIFEFGCGSGFNLAAAARLFPQAQLTGLDWVNQVALTQGYNLKGRRFDFFNPDDSLSLGPDSVILTCAALEQTGRDFTLFSEWLLHQRPKLVLNIEPILEFYDPSSLVDTTAMRYHAQRAYLNGYFSWLKDREREGQVDIILARRLYFGSLYHEAYSVLAWQPRSP